MLLVLTPTIIWEYFWVVHNLSTLIHSLANGMTKLSNYHQIIATNKISRIITQNFANYDVMIT